MSSISRGRSIVFFKPDIILIITSYVFFGLARIEFGLANLKSPRRLFSGVCIYNFYVCSVSIKLSWASFNCQIPQIQWCHSVFDLIWYTYSQIAISKVQEKIEIVNTRQQEKQQLAWCLTDGMTEKWILTLFSICFLTCKDVCQTKIISVSNHIKCYSHIFHISIKK